MIKLKVQRDPEQISTNPQLVFTDSGKIVGWIKQDGKHWIIWPDDQPGWLGNRFRKRKLALEILAIHAEKLEL